MSEGETKFVDLTVTKYRTVARVRVAWAADRMMWGPGGWGWASASFDAPRSGVERVWFTDGHFSTRQVSSEDEPEERAWVGQVVKETKVVSRARVAADEIPF